MTNVNNTFDVDATDFVGFVEADIIQYRCVRKDDTS